LGLEKDEYLELIELFIDTGMSDMNQLQDGIDERNPEKVYKAAHSLKGAAMNLGLNGLSETAEEIEEKASRNSMDEAEQAAQTLKKKLYGIEKLARTSQFNG